MMTIRLPDRETTEADKSEVKSQPVTWLELKRNTAVLSLFPGALSRMHRSPSSSLHPTKE